MASFVVNAAAFELRLMPQDAPKRSTRLRFHPSCRYEEEEEDEFYLQKIQELVNQKMKLFALQDQLGKNVKDSKKKTSTLKRPRSSVEEGENKKKKIQKRITVVRLPVVSNQVTDRLKAFITQEMKGSDIKVVIQKVLYVTDLTKSQNRLSMPINQLETHEFLTADEKRELEKGEEFKVPLLGPRLQMHENPMVLKMWHLKTTDNYVLKTNWNKFVDENMEDLKENTKVQVWSFRREQKLCFALACVERADGHNEAA